MYVDPSVNHDIVTCAVVLACVDTWSEYLTVSLILGGVHIGLVRLARRLN